MSYTIPNITFTNEDFVHHRNLGQKVPGSHMYPNTPWSDVVLQDVPIEVPMNLTHQDYLIGESLRTSRETNETTIVGDGHVDPSIRITENSIAKSPPYKTSRYGQYDGRRASDLKIWEKRRHFQVKPRLKVREHRNKYFKHNHTQ